jgi:hypothetical protein
MEPPRLAVVTATPVLVASLASLAVIVRLLAHASLACAPESERASVIREPTQSSGTGSDHRSAGQIRLTTPVEPAALLEVIDGGFRLWYSGGSFRMANVMPSARVGAQGLELLTFFPDGDGFAGRLSHLPHDGDELEECSDSSCSSLGLRYDGHDFVRSP